MTADCDRAGQEPPSARRQYTVPFLVAALVTAMCALACRSLAQGPTASHPQSSEVREFLRKRALCNKDVSHGEDLDECQDAVLQQGLCENGGQGPVCDYLRESGFYAATPVPISKLLGCWSVIQPGDDLAGDTKLIAPSTSLDWVVVCFAPKELVVGTRRGWDRWSIDESSYGRKDTRYRGAYAVGTHVGELRIIPDGADIHLVMEDSLTSTRLRRSERKPPSTLPSIETVCEQFEQCALALAAARSPEGEQVVGEALPSISRRTLSQCHCAFDSATMTSAAWTYDDTPPPAPTAPPACTSRGYDAEHIRPCLQGLSWVVPLSY